MDPGDSETEVTEPEPEVEEQRGLPNEDIPDELLEPDGFDDGSQPPPPAADDDQTEEPQ
jgi:hypothetical protein